MRLAAPTEFEYCTTVRYVEVDSQGVVFNAWYLTYCDEAMTAYLHARGLPYSDLLKAGFDTQLVHATIDWKSSLRWQDGVRVAVSAGAAGRTSFTMDFVVRRQDGRVACSAQIEYVVVAAGGSGKREIPSLLRPALSGPPVQDPQPESRVV